MVGWYPGRVVDRDRSTIEVLKSFFTVLFTLHAFIPVLSNYCLYANKLYTILVNGLICTIPTTCGVHPVLTLAFPTTHKGCSVEEDYEDFVEGEDAY